MLHRGTRRDHPAGRISEIKANPATTSRSWGFYLLGSAHSLIAAGAVAVSEVEFCARCCLVSEYLLFAFLKFIGLNDAPLREQCQRGEKNDCWFFRRPIYRPGWQPRQSNRRRGHLAPPVNLSSQFAINHRQSRRVVALRISPRCPCNWAARCRDNMCQPEENS